MLFTSMPVVLTGLVLLGLLLWLYWRCQRDDQRAINTVNNMLLPILSALAVSINLLFTHRQHTPACTGTIDILFYAGIGAAIALILLGCLIFFMRRRRDRRTITQPLLLATMLVTITFLTMYLNHCL